MEQRLLKRNEKAGEVKPREYKRKYIDPYKLHRFRPYHEKVNNVGYAKTFSRYKHIQRVFPELVSTINVEGIYFLFRRGKLVYVGKSKHMYKDIMHNLYSDRKKFDFFSYLPCKNKDEMKKMYVKKYKPRHNTWRK
jgi:hypothetical protein